MDGKQFSFPFICHDSKVDLKLISNLRIQRILSSVVFEKYFAIKKLKYHSFTFEKSFPYRNSFSTPVFLSSIIDEGNPNTESQSGDLSVPSEIVRAVFRHFRSAKRNDIEAGKMN